MHSIGRRRCIRVFCKYFQSRFLAVAEGREHHALPLSNSIPRALSLLCGHCFLWEKNRKLKSTRAGIEDSPRKIFLCFVVGLWINYIRKVRYLEGVVAPWRNSEWYNTQNVRRRGCSHGTCFDQAQSRARGLRIKGVPIPESKVSQLNEVKWP